MTPNTLATILFSQHEEFMVGHVRPTNCRHDIVARELAALVADSTGLLASRDIGQSLEGRSISEVSFGNGPKTVLLWSQMHGDEPTATLALLDIFHFLSLRKEKEEWIQKIFRELTVHVIPMLNPDGAERVQRWTAGQIDMNRDARMLATPEGRLLRQRQKELSPAFGFNLHDQGLSSVGNTSAVTALSLLAPAMDEEKSLAPVRLRAMRLGSLVARVLNQFVDGHLATYDDTYESRAFGDNMQAWGTSTLLIESGQWPGDPEKKFIRKLNFVAILTSLHAISTNAYQDAELDHYSRLKPNGKRCYDLIIRGVRVEHPSGWSHQADLGLLYQAAAPALRARGDNDMVVLKEVGDLSDFGAMQVIEGHERKISASMLAIESAMSLAALLDILQVYYHRPD